MFKQTFQQRLEAVGGHGPGFDLVRLVLCYEVMVWHCFSLSTGSPADGLASPLWVLFVLMVPMFFTLSGFLVTASAARLPVGAYLANRAARILPALFAVVGFAMLVAGPVATRLPLAEYFADPAFWRHARNLLAWPEYRLPGVFEANPFGVVVNGSLWTVRWEIGCYVMMALLVAAGLMRRPWVAPMLAMAWALLGVVVAPDALAGMPGRLLRQLLGEGGMLYPYFLGGASIWLFRKRVPWHGGIAALSVAAILAPSLLLDGVSWQHNRLLWLLMIVPSAYLVAWAGLARLAVPRLWRGGDYSYGIYLWHFPVLQLIQHWLHIDRWWLLLLVGFVPVTAIAAASWHWIEGPVLAARRRLPVSPSAP
jgi:peptidoglycan/LPS O-acetylase OafA/YrhL